MNQVTQIIAPVDNPRGLVLLNFYTQVIQAGSPGNSVQSLVLASDSAPASFTSKLKCFPIYRTFQSDKQDPIALGGFAPMNVMAVHIPIGWGLWQVLTVAGATLARNNVRIGVVFL